MSGFDNKSTTELELDLATCLQQFKHTNFETNSIKRDIKAGKVRVKELRQRIKTDAERVKGLKELLAMFRMQKKEIKSALRAK